MANMTLFGKSVPRGQRNPGNQNTRRASLHMPHAARSTSTLGLLEVMLCTNALD
jgi:hypothetical protein